MESPTTEQIKAARKKSGLTQESAAKLIYVDTRTWQKWEYGERKMKLAMFEMFLIKTNQHNDYIKKE